MLQDFAGGNCARRLFAAPIAEGGPHPVHRAVEPGAINAVG